MLTKQRLSKNFVRPYLDKDHLQPSVNLAKTPNVLTPLLARKEKARQEVGYGQNTHHNPVPKVS